MRFPSHPSSIPYRRLSSGALAIALLLTSAPLAIGQQNVLDSPDPSGVLRTITLDGSPLDFSNPFFQSLGTNGRSCVSCHVPSTGWTISPREVRARFEATAGLDPIFRTNDGSNSPLVDVSTFAARRKAFSMLLDKGLIRIGLPMPSGAQFEVTSVDDPYSCNTNPVTGLTNPNRGKIISTDGDPRILQMALKVAW